MRPTTLSLIATIASTVAFSGIQAASAMYPDDPYEIRCTTTEGKSVFNVLQINDGHGRTRLESTAGKGLPTVVIIDDFNERKKFILDQETKIAYCAVIKPGKSPQEHMAKIKEGKKLGTALIAGHSCEGFEESDSSTPGSEQISQIWLDVETGCPVMEKKTFLSNGKEFLTSVKTMTSCVAKVPAPSSFEVPTNYTLQEMTPLKPQ